jgi:hypothetical protein
VALSVHNLRSFSVINKNPVLISWIHTSPREDNQGVFYVKVFSPEICTHGDRASSKSLSTLRASMTLDSTLLNKAKAKL